MIEEIKSKTRELLKTKRVDLVIGYQRAADGVSAAPAFIFREGDTDKLIWDPYCVYNLPNYLPDFKGRRVAILAKGCDAKSIIVLLQENQIKRDEVFVIGIECPGVIDEKKLFTVEGGNTEMDFAARCRQCRSDTPILYDILVKEKEEKVTPSRATEDPYEMVKKLEAKSTEAKFDYWQEQFSNCIRCYACRQICPLCYCPKCVADQTVPSWFSRAALLRGNFAWNLTRAMHLAGRCIDCGECERACPVNIPLRDINKKIEKDIKELFGYEAGKDADTRSFLSGFDKSDPEDFIR